MTANEALAEARTAGITFTIAQGRIRYHAPEGAMTAELANAIKANRTEIMRMLARDRRPRARLTPTHCLGPSICAVIGVCGRMACVRADEAIDWMDAIEAARSPSNPHRVPEFDSIEEGAAAWPALQTTRLPVASALDACWRTSMNAENRRWA